MSDLEALRQAVITGNAQEAEEMVQTAVSANVPPEIILNKGLIAAMHEVGQLFESGQFFIPEMLVSSRAMKTAIDILKPHLMKQGVTTAGKIVIGTVKGDLHDIGKNLVATMVENAGFDVIDLGTDVSTDEFVKATRDYNPNFIGLSALLSTTMQYMESTIKAIEASGLRKKVKIIVGGAPVNEEFAREIGADGYAASATSAVALIKTLA
jgi:5-methyltetrahydrofolate--homocysteine methyltransferase